MKWQVNFDHEVVLCDRTGFAVRNALFLGLFILVIVKSINDHKYHEKTNF
ncbi:MAG: hypothetical protein ACXITR_00600 [Cyanobacterium sp.]